MRGRRAMKGDDHVQSISPLARRPRTGLDNKSRSKRATHETHHNLAQAHVFQGWQSTIIVLPCKPFKSLEKVRVTEPANRLQVNLA
jgi:hypothetical protein